MIKGVVVKKLISHKDNRGLFREIFRFPTDYSAMSVSQMSHSVVNEGVIKAWHSHRSQSQWNYVVSGTVLVVLLDNRLDSETYKEINTIQVGPGHDPIGYFFPSGVLHGYKCQKGPMHIIYLTSELYDPKEEIRIPSDDPDIGYKW